MKDYYKILEIEENATEDDIKKSYRVLSKKYHPDVNPDGGEKFKEIVEAYETLINDSKRREYDYHRKNPFQRSNEDIFANFFSNRRRRENSSFKTIKLNITPIESYNGDEKVISYIKNKMCETCNGQGGEKQTCKSCGGQGYQIKTFGNGFMIQQVTTECGSCGGKGYTLLHKCKTCDGMGHQSSNNTIKIKLPHGIDSGQFIRVQNEGDFKNGSYGDLIIQIEVHNSDGFEKMGDDLIYHLFLNYGELLNDKFTIPHPSGDITIASPNTIDTSRPLRVKGKGYRGGELYVRLNVRFNRK